MGIKFSAMSPKNFHELGGEVRTSDTKDGYEALQTGLDSSKLFGYSSQRGDEDMNLSRDNKRAYIHLTKPVFNYVLARSGGALLRKILGIPKKDMDMIVSYSVAWSEYAQCLVKIDELDESEELLCGAELIKKWIDDFDFQKAIKDEFLSIIIAAGGKAECTLSDFGTLNKDKKGFELAGGYYIDPAGSAEACMKRGHTLSEVTDYIKNTYFVSDETRLTFLLNMKNKDPLYGMVQEYVAVLPPGMRPSIQNRNDYWTKAYAKIIKANQELALTHNGELSHEERRLKYKALDNAVSKLQYKTDPSDKRIKSILEDMKGKHGQIRALNLGKRQDYSGRSAVIINPFLSLNKIRLPKEMLPKLFRYHILPYVEDKQIFNLISSANDEDCLRIIREQDLLNKVPVVLGRQPTLHKHGLQGFWAEETDAHATEVNPLVCPAFNMDFDGDTGHEEVPLSPEAIREVKDLILTTQNLYLPKTGECTICPRQDMLYGLFICTRSTYKVSAPVGTFANYQNVREAVISHKVKVYDTVTVAGETELAGVIAFKSCFPSGVFASRGHNAGNGKLSVVEINAKTIKQYVDVMLPRSTREFVAAIDSMVELGFKIARIYAPSMSLLKDLHSDTDKARAYDNAMKKFHEEMEEENDLYDLGLEDSATYNLEFDTKFKDVEDTMRSGIKDKLGTDNGYWLLAESGARGNASNLAQIFAYKGRIAKSSTESFNAIIENSFVSQLSPLEHFISAYGGRKGQIDKSLKTGDTGYAMRQMWHATNSYTITNDDCGTTDGITITKSDIAQFTDDADEVNDTFFNIINGRFRAGSNNYITKELAEQYTKDLDSIVIRSPLTCKNPCCRKCYGNDPSTNDDAVVGLPIGFIAAQSIGEPGTQLTMKQFQKGGVAGRGDVTSNFDRMNNYIHCASIHDMAKNGKYPTYDPVAWADGPIHEVSCGIVNKKITIGDNNCKSVILPQEALIKKVAVKGEGICLKRGDYDINEVLENSGIRRAQLYLIYALYNIYKSECKIVSKHFEVLVAAMTRHMIISTDRSDLKVGQYYTSKELYRGSLNNTEYVSRLIGVKTLPLISQSALSNIIFENIGKGLSKAVLLGTEETLEDPLPRMAMGLSTKAGSWYPDFIDERKRS